MIDFCEGTLCFWQKNGYFHGVFWSTYGEKKNRASTQICVGVSDRSCKKFLDDWLSLNERRVFNCLAAGLIKDINYISVI